MREFVWVPMCASVCGRPCVGVCVVAHMRKRACMGAHARTPPHMCACSFSCGPEKARARRLTCGCRRARVQRTVRLHARAGAGTLAHTCCLCSREGGLHSAYTLPVLQPLMRVCPTSAHGKPAQGLEPVYIAG